MRPRHGLTVAALVVGVGAAPASAGPPTLDDAGRFLVLQANHVPPIAGTTTAPRGIALEFSAFAGNLKTGEVPSGMASTRSLEFRSPQGLRFNHATFPRCRLEVLDTSGPTSCPRGSQIGTGTVIIDARPILPDFVRVTQALVFNGTYGSRSVRPSLLIWSKVGGLTLTTTADVRKARPGFGPTFFADNGATPGETLFRTVSVALTFPKRSTRVQGRTVSLFESPTTCRGSWLWQQVNTRYDGTTITANHRVPCLLGSDGR